MLYYSELLGVHLIFYLSVLRKRFMVLLRCICIKLILNQAGCILKVGNLYFYMIMHATIY